MKTLFTTLFCTLSIVAGAQSITQLIKYDVPISPKHVDDSWFESLERNGRDVLLKKLVTDVKEGRTKAYHNLDVAKQLTQQEIDGIFLRVDSMYIEDPEPPYHLRLTVTKTELDMQQIKSVRFYESWAADPKTGQVVKRVKAMMPLFTHVDGNGETMGVTPLYFVKWEEFELK